MMLTVHRLGFVLVSVVAVALAATTAMQLESQGSTHDLATRSDTVAVRSIDRADIITRVTNMTAIVRTVTRIEAKNTTWEKYLQSHEAGDTFLVQPTPLVTPVWVVAVAGEFHPPHSREAEAYKWGVIVFDANTGDWLRTEASYQDTWPVFFDRLH